MNGSYALMGSSAIIRHVQHLVFKIAENNAAVLITGEPGTGKDAIAKIIHEKSPRQKGPFLPVQCAALKEDSLEWDLFGRQMGGEGSFSSAHTDASVLRQSYFAQAASGTLYLDEVSKLPRNVQVLLLKSMQESCKTPSLEESPTVSDCSVKIICSTSFDLENLVRTGVFHEELYYKLSGASLYLPPLRERREDIPLLSEYFVQKYNQLKGKKIIGISHDAMNALLQNNWTYNVQELENLIERIVVLKNSGSIEICDLPPRLRNLVTDNIDVFYDRISQQQTHALLSHQKQKSHHNTYPHVGSQALSQYSKTISPGDSMHQSYGQGSRDQGVPLNRGASLGSKGLTMNTSYSAQHDSHHANYAQGSYGNPMMPSASNHAQNQNVMGRGGFEDLPGEIEQFIKKDIDLGTGIDFYRVVEEFENRLISEALRRTNHNKNRAAQLLSMNRTTLVEKLKKRAASTTIKSEGSRVKRNSAFTIFDGLGSESSEFEALDFLNIPNEESV